MTPIKLLSLPQVQTRTDSCKAMLYQYVREGLFPPPTKVGRKSVWPEHEVEAIVTARVGGASDDQVRSLVAKLIADRKRRFEALMQEVA